MEVGGRDATLLMTDRMNEPVNRLVDKRENGLKTRSNDVWPRGCQEVGHPDAVKGRGGIKWQAPSSLDSGKENGPRLFNLVVYIPSHVVVHFQFSFLFQQH